MFYKLAINNFKKSSKEFLIYFLTLAFGVCLFYSFNSIGSQQIMLKLNDTQRNIVQEFVQIIGNISIFISIILAFLIIYANSFLIKRRKREFGIYMLLGMQKSKISKVLIVETFIIGLFSLGIGLIIGIFLSQILSLFTASLFEINLKSFNFVFSLSSFEKTIMYFGIIFIVVILFNTIAISRYKLIDLIYASKKNESLRFKKLWIPVLIFVISVATIIYAYYRIFHYGILELDNKLLVTTIIGCIGTLLFFLSLAGFVLKLVQLNKKLYFRGLNIFVLRQINNKINTNFISTTIVCLMLFITILTLSAGFTVSNIFSKDIQDTTPYDASIVLFSHKVSENGFNYDDIFKQYDVDLSKVSKQIGELNLYSIQDFKYGYIFENVDDSLKKSMSYINDQSMDIAKISDFNNNLIMQGKQSLKLDNNKYYLLCNINEIKKYAQNFINENKSINIGDYTLLPENNKLLDYGIRDYMGKEDVMLIVPDNVLSKYLPKQKIINLNYINNKNDENENTFRAMIKAAENKSSENGEAGAIGTTLTRKVIYDQNVSLKVMVTYVAIYIGIVFLITSAAVLALQQLTESSDNIQRYKLLKQIGSENSMINKALFVQISIYFLVPLTLAIIHSIIGIKVLNNAMVLLGSTDILANILFTAAIIVLIYGGYMVATYIASKRILTGNEY